MNNINQLIKTYEQKRKTKEKYIESTRQYLKLMKEEKEKENIESTTKYLYGLICESNLYYDFINDLKEIEKE